MSALTEEALSYAALHKPALIKHRHNRKLPRQYFSAAAEIVHQQQVRFDVLGLDNRVALARVRYPPQSGWLHEPGRLKGG
jgi:hypothetical protein